MIARVANYCVQATPGYGFCLFLSQRSGAPDAERWTAFSYHAGIEP